MKVTVKEKPQNVYNFDGRVVGKREGRVLEANVKSLQGLRVWCRHHRVEDAEYFQDGKKIGESCSLYDFRRGHFTSFNFNPYFFS